MAEPELLTAVVEGVGVLRLNRPAAINALTVSMMVGMREALEAWRDDDGVDSVLLLGEGSRGLCAGADVRALRTAVLEGRDYGEFFDLEYGLDNVNTLVQKVSDHVGDAMPDEMFLPGGFVERHVRRLFRARDRQS